MRVLGVDPGSAVTGFGIVEGAPGNFHYVAAGTIRSRAGEPMTQRPVSYTHLTLPTKA